MNRIGVGRWSPLLRLTAGVLSAWAVAPAALSAQQTARALVHANVISVPVAARELDSMRVSLVERRHVGTRGPAIRAPQGVRVRVETLSPVTRGAAVPQRPGRGDDPASPVDRILHIEYVGN